MVRPESTALKAVSCAALLLMGGAVQAQSLTGISESTPSRLDAVSQELFDQKQMLQQVEWLRQQFVQQSDLVESLERRLIEQQAALDALRGIVGHDVLAAQRGTGVAAQPPLMAQASQSGNSPVGQAPVSEGRPPEVAPIFEQPGVLTQPGQYVLEPSVQYGYSSSNRVALVGY
ncbi:MAG: acetate kinase, partial [Rhodoferax sp.]|nr:acetate kinase [Rhodoferax sp.]